VTYALLINQDRLQGEAIVAALTDAGIESRLAGSQLDAVPLLQEEQPAVLLWDWPAGDIPAEIFIALLRQEGFGGALVVCASSLDARGLPYDVLICKPFDMNHLTATVGRLICETEGTSCPDGLGATGS
jgi:DNA-binding response OmpR family regulator